jgi:hypothetical protein
MPHVQRLHHRKVYEEYGANLDHSYGGLETLSPLI